MPCWSEVADFAMVPCCSEAVHCLFEVADFAMVPCCSEAVHCLFEVADFAMASYCSEAVHYLFEVADFAIVPCCSEAVHCLSEGPGFAMMPCWSEGADFAIVPCYSEVADFGCFGKRCLHLAGFVCTSILPPEWLVDLLPQLPVACQALELLVLGYYGRLLFSEVSCSFLPDHGPKSADRLLRDVSALRPTSLW